MDQMAWQRKVIREEYVLHDNERERLALQRKVEEFLNKPIRPKRESRGEEGSRYKR